MNYAQRILLGKLKELQDGRRKHNYFAATSEEKHWDNEFSLIKAIKLLNGEAVKVQSFCHPPNVLHCKLQIYPDYDCSKCKWKLDKTSET